VSHASLFQAVLLPAEYHFHDRSFERSKLVDDSDVTFRKSKRLEQNTKDASVVSRPGCATPKPLSLLLDLHQSDTESTQTIDVHGFREMYIFIVP